MTEEKLETLGFPERVQTLIRLPGAVPERPLVAKWRGMPPRPERVPGWKVGTKPEQELEMELGPVLVLVLEPLVAPVRLQPLKRVREPEPDLPAGPASLKQATEPGGKLELKTVRLPRGVDLEALVVPIAAMVPALEPRLAAE